MLAIRNTPLFAIVAMPVVAGNLRGVWLTALERGWIRQSRQRFVTITIAVSMLALVAGVSAGVASDKVYRWLRWQRRFGVAETEHYPSGVVERLRAIEGRFFNNPDTGGYLIWKLYPDKQVATDGRWEVYGELLPRLAAVVRGPRAFSAFAREHDITAVALSRKSALARSMLPWLKKSREFELTLTTSNAMLFEKVSARE